MLLHRCYRLRSLLASYEASIDVARKLSTNLMIPTSLLLCPVQNLMSHFGA